MNQITLRMLIPGLYVAILAGAVVGGCANPVKDTYGKGVEGGQRAIEKAKGTQDSVDESARQIQEQEKQLEGSP